MSKKYNDFKYCVKKKIKIDDDIFIDQNIHQTICKENFFIQSKQQYDFDELAIKHDDLENIVILKNGISTINWQDPKSVIALTRCLMKESYKIDYWDIPDSNLCPTINSRRSYIDWIQFLLQSQNSSNNIYGIDIGTGASLVYPLIGFKLFDWKFYATDNNQESIENAKKILSKNKIKSEDIKLIKSQKKIFEFLQITEQSFSFSMCNPPYFNDWEQKQIIPSKNSSIKENEALTEGGEVQFIKQMIDESVEFKDRIKIFTTLVGVKSHFDEIFKLLIKFQEKYRLETQFECIQNGKVKRWLVAWKYI